MKGFSGDQPAGVLLRPSAGPGPAPTSGDTWAQVLVRRSLKPARIQDPALTPAPAGLTHPVVIFPFSSFRCVKGADKGFRIHIYSLDRSI